MFKRSVKPFKSESFFLFGARGTGKTTFLRQHYESENTLWIDLLDPELEDQLSRSPNQLLNAIAGFRGDLKWVVIDEVQKCPKLLNIVHQQIESRGLKFALTGSSARRLKQQGVNLLAGRALTQFMFPLSHRELGERFVLDEVLQWGSLPKIFELDSGDLKNDFLRSYSLSYITHEVQAEQWVRKLEPFRKFLPIAAQMNGQLLNYANIARDVGADATTVKSYFEILEDTLLGFHLEAFDRSIRKRQTQSPKFYFFDPGVKRALDQTLTVPLLPRSSGYGDAFEHFVVCECLRLSAYEKNDFRFSYLRTKDDAEVDLVVERPGKPLLLIEIKSKILIDERDTTNLRRFVRDIRGAEALLISNDPVAKNIDGIVALPWREGLSAAGM